MPENKQTDRPVQTTPAGHEIPVPSREDVFGDLRKVASAAPPPKPKRKSKRRKSS